MRQSLLSQPTLRCLLRAQLRPVRLLCETVLLGRITTQLQSTLALLALEEFQPRRFPLALPAPGVSQPCSITLALLALEVFRPTPFPLALPPLGLFQQCSILALLALEVCQSAPQRARQLMSTSTCKRARLSLSRDPAQVARLCALVCKHQTLL